MRTMSWIKHPVIILLAATIAAGCGSDSNSPATQPSTGNDAGAKCGNNKKEGSEVCDGTDLNKMTCQTAMLGMYTGGKLACKADCSGFDPKGCTKGGGGAGGQGGTNNGGTGGGVGGTGGGPKMDGGVDSGAMDSGAGGTDSGTKMDSSTPPVDAGQKG